MNKTFGDGGKTNLLNKKNLTKTDKVFNLLGDLDELNSFLGLAKINLKSKKIKKWIEEIQKDIFSFSSWVAGAEEAHFFDKIDDLDSKIRYCQKSIPAITSFITPGDSKESAYLDIARAICRRAERSAWKANQIKSTKEIAIWLNHLSKFLFFLARLVDKRIKTR